MFYVVLAAISIGGSIGGISSATNTAHRQEDVRQRIEQSYNLRIEAIEQEIKSNDEAARRYIELNRIATGYTKMMKINQQLRAQQQALRDERDTRPVSHQTSMLGLIGGIADGLKMSVEQAQFWLVVALSLLATGAVLPAAVTLTVTVPVSVPPLPSDTV